MSDYSPPDSPNAFDELEDLLYDADPAPDLADELASHALHSPLLYAYDYQPGYEQQEYISDWEYYSDDYYDDDPDILKKYPIDGTKPASTKEDTHANGAAQGRKRKLADVEEDSKLDDRRYLKACMKGTVWATPVPPRDNHYRAGEGAKVALLKDWKARFGTMSPKKNTAKAQTIPRLPEDESWANDLSLADMGLTSARGSRVEQDGGGGDDDEDGYESEDGDDEIEFAEEALALLKQAALEAAAEHKNADATNARQPEQGEALTHRARTASPPASARQDSSDPISNTNNLNDTSAQRPTKRPRKALHPQPTLPTPPASHTSTTAPAGRTTRARAGSAASSTTASIPQPAAKPNTRKRKASSPAAEEEEESHVDEDGGGEAGRMVKVNDTNPGSGSGKSGTKATSRATSATTSSRAKRAASAAHNVTTTKEKGATGPARATRTRK